jgi:isopenicillin N synthase-like dioxygenase
MREIVRSRIESADNEDTHSIGTIENYPCVDISSWVDPEGSAADREKVVMEVLKHATETGSFNVCGHGVPEDLICRLQKSAHSFFSCPLHEKDSYATGNNMSGYARVMQERVGAVYGSEGLDLRESFSVKDPYGSNRGLLAPMDLTPYLQYYYMHMERLDVILHNILAQALAEAKGVT